MIWTAACGSCCRRFILKPSTLTSCAPLSANICKYHKQDKTVAGLVQELKKLSTEVASDKDLANVASVSGEGRRAADHNPCALRRCVHSATLQQFRQLWRRRRFGFDVCSVFYVVLD